MVRMSFLAALVAVLAGMPSTGAASGGRRVEFARPDGVTLVGYFAAVDSQRRPAVLLLHQPRSDHSEFDFLLPDLHRLGVQTLAVDIRGHGESTKPPRLDGVFFRRVFKDPDFLPPDIQAILAWMAAEPTIDPERIAVLGGNVGGNLAYLAAGAGWGVKAAVVLSGNSANVDMIAAETERFEPRGVFIIAADKDPAREQFAYELYERARKPKRIEILHNSMAHGVSILRESDRLRAEVLDWLGAQLSP